MNAIEERLGFPIASAQAVTANLFTRCVNFAPDQTMGPMARNLIGSPQDGNRAVFIGTADIDNATFDRCLLIPAPTPGQGAPFRCAIYPLSVTLAQSGHILPRLNLQRRQTFMLKAAPHLFLPQAVIAFYGILQPVLAWRRKGRHDSQTQTKPNHSTDYPDTGAAPGSDYRYRIAHSQASPLPANAPAKTAAQIGRAHV